MKLNKDDVPCDCEKATDSDSNKHECNHGQDMVKWLKNNEEDFEDIFEVDIDHVVETVEECYNLNCFKHHPKEAAKRQAQREAKEAMK